MIFGYLYLRSNKSRINLLGPVSRWYHDYKLQRAKKKFQVYLRKRESEHDRFVN
jgi:hypothetical protein